MGAASGTPTHSASNRKTRSFTGRPGQLGLGAAHPHRAGRGSPGRWRGIVGLGQVVGPGTPSQRMRMGRREEAGRCFLRAGPEGFLREAAPLAAARVGLWISAGRGWCGA